MEVIKVRDILQVDTISKSTNAWKTLIEIADKATGDIQFDFRGIQLIEPWLNEDFKQLMSNERVRLKVYTAEKLQNTIELMLAFGGMKTGRVENEDILEAPTLSERDKKINFVKTNILSAMRNVDGKISIELGNIVSYMTESLTIEALDQAIDKFVKEGVKEFRAGLSGITIADPILMKIAELINKYNEQDITIEMTSDNEDVINKIITFQCVGSRKLSPKERFDIFKETIKPKTVGMLTKYCRTGRLDSLGRMGDGQPLFCRVAIFDGFVKKDGEIVAKFTTFPASTFYTKQDYYLDNDGIVLKKMRTEVIYASMTDIGVCDKFTGREFHFNLPVQLTPEGGYTTYVLDGESVKTTKLILPEYIKKVLDDHLIEYDSAQLLDVIVENKRLLREKFNAKI